MKVNNKEKLPYLLIVDDEEMNRFVLQDLIDERYDLELLDCGEACLESIEKRLPELILLDINMPGIDGFEVCEKLKANPETSHIPIIFLTAKILVEDERLGLELGAVDYITKPFSESILLARIETHLTLSETRLLLEKSNAALRRERDYIEYIMTTMRDDSRYVKDQLSALISPVESSNGDLVLSANTSKGHRHIMIGDFTGHGLSAAIAGPLVSSLFYSQAEQGISLSDTANMINAELQCKLPTEIFMAAIFIDWDPDTNKVLVWNRGMPPLQHYRDNKCIHSFASSGLALGIIEQSYPDDEIEQFSVSAGDALFAYSDGVQEVEAINGERFGDQRIKPLLENVLRQDKPLEWVLDVLKDFSQEVGIDDDATLIQINIA